MADRRSAATKAEAGVKSGGISASTPSSSQTSKSKATEAVTQQQANKGLTQKDLALKYGGRYAENGSIYQVDTPSQSRGGTAYSIELRENLGFSDSVKAQRESESRDGGVTTKRTSTYYSGDESKPKSYQKTSGQPQGIKNKQGGTDYTLPLSERLNLEAFTGRPPSGSSSNIAFDEGGEVTYSEKKSFSRESRQEIKDFLRTNPAESYQILDSEGKFITLTSGRNAYPDILKFALGGQVSIMPVTKLATNQTYVALGIGNPVFIINKPEVKPTKTPTGKTQGNILQSNFIVGEKQGPQQPDNSILGRYGQLSVPLRNQYTDIRNAITGEEVKTKPTGVANALTAAQAYLTPGARDLFAGSIPFTKEVNESLLKGTPYKLPTQINPTTAEERSASKSAISNFKTQAKYEYKQDPLGYILPIAGEGILIGATLGAFKGGQIAYGAIKEAKVIKLATKDLRNIIAPKQMVRASVKEKISSGAGTTGLSKNIGGEALQPTKIDIQYIGGNVVRLESKLDKQKEILLYDVKKKTFQTIGPTAEGDVYTSIRQRGSLSDVTQKASLQTSQQKQFGLTQVSKDVFVTADKPNPTIKQQAYLKKHGLSLEQGGVNKNLVNAIRSDNPVIAPAGKFRTFTLEQARKNPQLFGRALYGGEAYPVNPKQTVGLAESIGYRSGGTAVGKEKPSGGYYTKELPGVKTTIETKVRGPGNTIMSKFTTKQNILKFTEPIYVPGKRDVFGNVFKPFKESKLKLRLDEKIRGSGNYIYSKLTTEKYTKKLPTASFVTDVQKHTRFIDPYSKAGKLIPSKVSTPWSKTFPTETPSVPSTGKTMNVFQTSTKEQRDVFVKEEMDILFQKPRFAGDYIQSGGITGSVLASAGEQRPSDIYGNKMVESPTENIFSGKDTTKLNIKPETKIRSKTTPYSVSDIVPKIRSDDRLKTNIFTNIIPKLNQPTALKSTPDLATKISVTQIPIQTPIQTPQIRTTQTTKTTQIQTPKFDIFTPPKPIIPEEVIPPPIFGVPPGPRGGRDFDSPSPPQGENLDWRGNVPEDSIIGIYGKRSETTYTIGRVPGLKKREKFRRAKPIKGFGNTNSLNISNKNNSFSGKGKSKTSIFSKSKGKKFNF